MRKLSLPLLILLLLVSPALAQEAASPNPGSPDPGSPNPGFLEAGSREAAVAFFEKRIRPVLVEHCYECHSGTAEAVKGSLRVDTREALLHGGESGTALVPGDSGASLLLSAIEYDSFEMPPDGKLPASVIEDFRRWIDGGAVDPREGSEQPTEQAGIDLEEGRQFWAFRPTKRPVLPQTQDRLWSRGPIDVFLLARMEEAGLAPAADAGRRTLLRRLYFDLLGLPPSASEMQLFLADESPSAFETAVDRLLASPHFGERWGRRWLDVARFAESTGGGRTRILHNAWRYRDYVLSAWNVDKPYDRFVSEQLAGDLLPWEDPAQRADQLTATGFLALGPINYELQDKKLLDMEIVDEQLDSMGRTFLGMTIGCARCHDHKFDPIPTRDYYALAGIFRSTKTVEHSNVSNYIERPLPLPTEQQAAYESYLAEVDKHEKQLAALDKMRGKYTVLPSDLRRLSEFAGTLVDDTSAELAGNWTASTSVQPFVGESYRHASANGAGMPTARFATQLGDGEYYVRVSYSAHGNRASNARIQIEHADGDAEVRLNQRQPPRDDPVFFTLGKFRFRAEKAAAVLFETEGADGVVIVDAVQFLPVDSASAGTEARTQAQDLARLEQEKRQLTTKLSSLKANAPPAPPEVLTVVEGDTIEDSPLHIRGNVRQLGDAVPRGFLQVASWSPADAIPTTASGRRELVEWITSPQNPLTARVMVNRLWHHLMGTGLVRTVDNFGATGEQPSHPDLLDYLATEFVRQDWSTKAMIREIVLSRAYGMTSEVTPMAIAKDPENRLFSYRTRRRLDAESIRDALLQTSGQLDRHMHGPSLSLDVKSEFGYEFQSRRRSVYVPVFRNTLHDLFAVFDFANPNLVSGSRTTSTLPTQALYLMNSPFVMECAQIAAADHLTRRQEKDAALSHDIAAAFERVLGRPPLPAERIFVESYLSEFDKTSAAQQAAWTRVFQTLFACLDFRYLE